MRGSRFLLDSLINLLNMKEQAEIEGKLERIVIIEEIFSERLRELTDLVSKGGD